MADSQTLETQVKAVFSDDFGTNMDSFDGMYELYYSLYYKRLVDSYSSWWWPFFSWWQPSWSWLHGLPRPIGRMLFRSRRIQRSISDELSKLCNKLSAEDGPMIKHIKDSIKIQVEDVMNTVVPRLNAEIEAVERQLNAKAKDKRDKALEKKRLEKIDSLLTAKYEEISRVVFGKVLDPEQLRAQGAQSRRGETSS